ADADAAEKERGQPNEADELGEAVGVAAERWGRIGPVMDGEARLWELLLDVVPRIGQEVLVGRARFGELHPVHPADQVPRLDQPGMSTRLARHEQLRSIAGAVSESVRLLAENAADGHCRIADGDLAADVEIEPVEQRPLDEHDIGIAPHRPWLLGSG